MTPAHRTLKIIETILVVLGAAALLIAGLSYGYISIVKLDAKKYNFAAAHPTGHSTDQHSWWPESAVIGRLSVAGVGLDVPVVEGSSRLDLLRGAGHIAGTSDAGSSGTSAYAGHRDTYFSSLQYVRPGMRISFNDRRGSYEYVVERTLIVRPSDISVFAPTQTSRLVLITCYPFHFIGPAPKRFIVISSPLP